MDQRFSQLTLSQVQQRVLDGLTMAQALQAISKIDNQQVRDLFDFPPVRKAVNRTLNKED
jgi:hypothetical protein